MTAVHGDVVVRAPEDPGDQPPVEARLAMAGSLVAGLLHLLVAPGHWTEAWWLGTFFVVAGLAQLALAVLVRRRRRPWVLLAGIGGTFLLLALYVASRTLDLWFMPPHGAAHAVEHLPVAGGVGNGLPVLPGDRIEPVGPVDLTCAVAELVVLAMLLSLLPDRLRARMGTALVAASVALSAAVWLLAGR